MAVERHAQPGDTPAPSFGAAAAGAETDPDLADAVLARGGNIAATERLVLRHQPAIARLLWRFARNSADLNDLVQDTFVRAVRGLPGWRSEQPFAHWLLRIATNVGRDYFRRSIVRRRWMAAEPVEIAGAALPEPAADPAARAAANEAKALLATLPPDDRALLTLHHLEGWSLAAIASHYGWTVTATKLRAWRARRLLRQRLQPHERSKT